MTYRVYELKNNYKIEYVILSENSFKKMNLCDTFDDYGQRAECYEIGCYSLDNLDSSFGPDMAKYFGWNAEIMEEIYEIEDLETTLIEQSIPYDIGAIKKYIAEKEDHISCKAYNYWDGSNHQTLILESDLDYTDLEEIEPDLECKILKAFEKFNTYVEKGWEKTEEIDGFEFYYSLMSGFIFEAAILK